MQQVPVVEDQMPATASATSAPRRRRTWYAVLILCFFAAVIPESIATWSTAVAEILANPGNLLFVILFYGPADLLIREALIRRRLGWVSLILLGIAFGFFNEGVVAGTWYTQQYAGYAYFGGVDIAWAVALTVFHVFISVIIPIAFFEVLFPSLAGVPLLRRRRGIIISAVIFLLVTSLVGFVPAYRPYRLAVFFVALALAIVALRLPAARPRALIADQPPGLWKLRWAGFCASVVYVALILIVPSITLNLAGPYTFAAQGADIVIFLLFSALLLRKGRRWTARAGWSLRHTLALITGVLMFPIMLVTLLPPLWGTLELFATIPFFVLLIALNLRLRRRERAIGGSTAHFLVNGDAAHDEGDPQDFDGRRNLA